MSAVLRGCAFGPAVICSVLGWGSLAWAGCNGDPGAEPSDECVPIDPSTCAPLYPPTYANIYERTLVPTCGAGNSACHRDTSASGAQAGGLGFAGGPQATYELLLEDAGTATYVIPDDPSCSALTRRLTTSDPTKQMPPGAPLDPGAQCSIAQWIAQGAPP